MNCARRVGTNTVRHSQPHVNDSTMRETRYSFGVLNIERVVCCFLVCKAEKTHKKKKAVCNNILNGFEIKSDICEQCDTAIFLLTAKSLKLQKRSNAQIVRVKTRGGKEEGKEFEDGWKNYSKISEIYIINYLFFILFFYFYYT